MAASASRFRNAEASQKTGNGSLLAEYFANELVAGDTAPVSLGDSLLDLLKLPLVEVDISTNGFGVD